MLMYVLTNTNKLVFDSDQFLFILQKKSQYRGAYNFKKIFNSWIL